MKLIGHHGAVKEAWFDARQIDPDYRGIHCLVAIGEEGGIICLDISSPTPLHPMTIQTVAADASIALEAEAYNRQKKFILETEDGERVTIAPSEDDPGVINDVITSLTNEQIIANQQAPKYQFPIDALIISFAMTLLSIPVIIRYHDDPVILPLAALVLLAGIRLLRSTIKMIRRKSQEDHLSLRLGHIILREQERRRKVDELVRTRSNLLV